MGFFTQSQHLGAAAVIMSLSVFFSRFMGLVRDKVISYFYGAGPETDIYFISFAIPDFINYLLAGGYFSITLIPLLTRFFEKDPDDGWRFFSAAFWWVSIASIFAVAVAWIFAHPLSYVAAPLYDDAQRVRLVYFLRIILPAQVCFLPGACFTALLFMRRQFSIPALTPLVYNGCIILVGVLFMHLFPQSGMEGFLWGVLTGAFLGSFVLPCLAARSGGLHISLAFLHPGLKKFILLALPLMLGQSIVVLDEQFIRIFGSMGPEGSVSLLNYARRLMMVPVGVVAQAAGVASYPFLASLAAKGDNKGFDGTMNRSLLTAMAVILPLSFWMMAASGPIIRLIYQQGRFDPAMSAEASMLLVIMLCGVGFWTVQQILGRGFYAQENTITPVLAGTAGTALGLPLYFILGGWLSTPGVALAGVLSVALYTAVLAGFWMHRLGDGALRSLGRRCFALVALGAPCALLAYGGVHAADMLLPLAPLGAACLGIVLSGLLFAGPYLLLCRLLTPRTWNDTAGVVLRLFKRKKNA